MLKGTSPRYNPHCCHLPLHQIGHYEIHFPFGAGGMGEVYRARDTRLGRDVAIKVLHGSMARDADRLRRFENEARTVAALNHPNVISRATWSRPNGKWIFAHDLAGQGTLYPTAGGTPRPIPDSEAADIWIQWAADGRSGYVYRDEKTSASVFGVDVASGKRGRIWALGPGDPAGGTSIYRVRMTSDGKTYAYSYVRDLSDLFLVERVR